MDNAKLQLVVVYATQSTCHGYNFPKGSVHVESI